MYEHGLPWLELAVIDQRIPSGQRSDGQRRSLYIGHVMRGTNGAVFVDDHVLSQTTRQRRAEAVSGLIVSRLTIQPAGVQVRVHTVSYAEARDTLTDRDDRTAISGVCNAGVTFQTT